MLLGNHIDVALSLDGGQTKASVNFNGKLIGGIESVDLEVAAGPFGEEMKRLVFQMWEPREMFYDEEQFSLQQDFINEARRCGATVNLRSVLDFPNSPPLTEEEDEPESGTADMARIAAACVAIAGLATFLAPKNKKHKVQKKTAVSKLAEHQSAAVIKK